MMTEHEPETGTTGVSDELRAMMPRLRAEAQATSVDAMKLQEARRQLDPDRRALEAAVAETPGVVSQYAAGFERDAALLHDLMHERRPGLGPVIEHALQAAQGALSACLAIGGQQQRALDRLRTLSELDLHHVPVSVLVSGLREQFQGLARFALGVPTMRSRLDEQLRQIRDRLVASAPPATPGLETLPPPATPRQERAMTGPRDQEGLIHG
jgi:hypothetical protein